MAKKRPEGDALPMPRRWGPRLWWIGLLSGLVGSYFVLRNFELSFSVFLPAFLAFLTGGALAGRGLGMLLDRRLVTDAWRLQDELRALRSLHAWMKSVQERRAARLDKDTARRLDEGLVRLADRLKAEDDTWQRVREARLREEEFADKQLGAFKKGVVREYVESVGVAVLVALLLRAFVLEAFQIPSQSMVPTLEVGDHLFVNKLSYGVRVPLLPMKLGDVSIPAVAFRWAMPEPGDVIVFITPENEQEDYIKRVVAVAGDTIQVRDGVVSINGRPYALADGRPYEYNRLDEGRFVGVEVTQRFLETTGQARHAILRKACATDRDCYGLGVMCDPTRGFCRSGDFGPYTVPEDHVFVMGDNRDNSRDSRVWKSVPFEFIKGKAKFIWWSYREGQVRWERMFTGIE
jgi:signal peptidase I